MLEIRCPRCGNGIRDGARFCANCGLDLQSPIPPPPPQPPTPYVPSSVNPSWTAPSQTSPEQPVMNVGVVGRSVVSALTPARPAGAAFWVGLVMSILALLLVACPTLLAFALAIDPAQEESGDLLRSALSVSCCLLGILLLPGLTLVLLGRPRRY